MTPHTKGLWLATIGVLILTPDTMLIRLIGGDAWNLVFWRGLGVFLLIFIQAGFQYGPRHLIPQMRATGLYGIGAGLSFLQSSIAFVMAMKYTTAANLLVILATSPVWAILMSRIWLAEKPPAQTLLTIIACFLGVVLVFSDGLTRSWGGVGEWLALAASLSLAANLTLIRAHDRWAKNKLSSPSLTIPYQSYRGDMLLMNGLGSLFTCVIVGVTGDPLHYSFTQLPYLFLLCAVVLPLSFILIGTAPRYMPSAEVGLIMILETALGPIWVWLAVGESASWRVIMGGIIVVIALVWHGIWRVRHPNPKDVTT